MKYLVEVLDERDKGKVEEWSHFNMCDSESEFAVVLAELRSYVREYPIVDIRIHITR